MTANQPTTWLAEAADWMTRRLSDAHRTPAQIIERFGEKLIVWTSGDKEAITLDPPPRRLVFSDLESFGEFVTAHAEKAIGAPPGASGRPWRPAVLIGPRFAVFAVDPFRHLEAALALTVDPAFELLERLEAGQKFMDQKQAHDLARLDLARLLPPAAAQTLAAVSFKVTATTARTVGPIGDKGVRQFAQEQERPEDGAAQLVGPFAIQAPVFTLPTRTQAGPVSYSASLTLDLSVKLDQEDQTPYFRLAPIVGQCRTARAVAAGQLATALAAEVPVSVPVYLAHIHGQE